MDREKIERIEVIRANSPLEALLYDGRGEPFRFGQKIEDPSEMIGAEVILQLNRNGESLHTPYIRVIYDGYPFLSRRTNPNTMDTMLGGGLATTNKDKNLTMAMVHMLGKTWYFMSSGSLGLDDMTRPQVNTYERVFFDMAVKL